MKVVIFHSYVKFPEGMLQLTVYMFKNKAAEEWKQPKAGFHDQQHEFIARNLDLTHKNGDASGIQWELQVARMQLMHARCS